MRRNEFYVFDVEGSGDCWGFRFCESDSFVGNEWFVIILIDLI